MHQLTVPEAGNCLSLRDAVVYSGVLSGYGIAMEIHG
jgi:hypothetical protein